MPLNPGNNTVTFALVSWNGTPDRLGVTGPVSTPYEQPGVSMQPISGGDKPADTQYSEATWKCIALANPVTSQAKAEDFIWFNGVQYRIIFVKTYYDDWGRVDHITFMCKEQDG